MTDMDATPPISTFYRASASKTVTIYDVFRERALYTKQVMCLLANSIRLLKILCEIIFRASANKLPKKFLNFIEWDFVPVTCHDFHAGKKLFLHCRDPFQVFKALNGFLF